MRESCVFVSDLHPGNFGRGLQTSFLYLYLEEMSHARYSKKKSHMVVNFSHIWKHIKIILVRLFRQRVRVNSYTIQSDVFDWSIFLASHWLSFYFVKDSKTFAVHKAAKNGEIIV